MSTETRTEIEAFCERYATAWNQFDADAIAPLLTEDIVWHDPALPGPARGVAAVQEFMRTSWRAFPDLSFSEPERPHLSQAGDHVAWAWRMRGTMTGPMEPPGFAPTGRAVDVDGVDLWEMRDGRIAHYRAFYDANGLARQLGIVPEAGSRGEKGMVALQRLQARMARVRA